MPSQHAISHGTVPGARVTMQRESLAAFMQRHREALAAEAETLVNARILQLQEHE